MQQKIIQLTLLVVFSSIYSFSFSQSIKYKKGNVFVDKELAFVIKEKERKSKKENKKYEMLDANGEIVFTLIDSTIYYKQLDHETSQRIAYEVHILHAPKLNRKTEVPLIGLLNFPSRINYILKKTDLYTTKEFTNDVFDHFADKLQAKNLEFVKERYSDLNSRRDSVNEQAVLYNGPLVKREPSSIFISNGGDVNKGRVLESQKVLFTYKSNTKGKYAHNYDMYNEEGDLIGKFNLFQTEPFDNIMIAEMHEVTVKGKTRMQPKMHNKIWFKVPKVVVPQPESDEQRMKRLFTYLIEIGAI